MLLALLALVTALATLAFIWGRSNALACVGGDSRLLHSRPHHYGAFAALWCALPAAAVALAWGAVQGQVFDAVVLMSAPADVRELPAERLDRFVDDVRNLASGEALLGAPGPAAEAAAATLRRSAPAIEVAAGLLAALAGLGGFATARSRIQPSFRARAAVERIATRALWLCAGFAILITLGIVLSLVFEAARFFAKVPASDFLFGMQWSPQTALRADQVGSSGAFGAIPVFWGTAMITLIAMVVSVPVGLLSAVYLAEYASARARTVLKPLLEILAGVPTVVYGFFAALTVGPVLRAAGESLGLSVASESALAAGLVMGVMIIPFVSSLSDDVIKAVPQALREGSYGLGATRSETIRQVVLPAALPGIVAAVLLAVSRAIGETMIVVMAAGLAAKLTWNPLDAVTTVTVQIVTLLVGDQEFDSAKTLAAFALGLALFVVTLSLNAFALVVVRRYREQYD